MDEGATAQGALVGGWWGSASSDVMSQLCRVCGEPAAGFHFGAFTCEGCKSFFGRTYNNPNSISECKNQGACVINKKNRTSCKACRLRKCLLVGMSKSGSRYGRRSNWFKIHCLLQEQQHQQQQLQQQLPHQPPPPPHHPQPHPPPLQHPPPRDGIKGTTKSGANGKPGPGTGDSLFGSTGFPGVLWASRPLLQPPPPPPHLPALPFLGAPFLPPFNGGPTMFPITPRPEWAARLPTPAPAAKNTPSPTLPRGFLPASARPPSPPEDAPRSPLPTPVQEQPMDLSRTAVTHPRQRPAEDEFKPAALVLKDDDDDDSSISLKPHDLVARGMTDKDEGSDSGVSERESDRVGDGDGEADRDSLVGAVGSPMAGPGTGRPAMVPNALDLSSRA